MLSLIRRRPERGLSRLATPPVFALREEMENLFDRFFDGWNIPEEWTELRDWETTETDTEIVMRLALPGFEAKEMDLRIEGNVFVVRVNHPEGTKTTEENAVRPMERYEYRFTLPFGTDVNRVEATYRNGVLELHLPRLPEAQPRRVEVKT